MKQINYVELAGIVGSTKFKPLNDGNMVKFLLNTSYIEKDTDGVVVVGNIWHNAVAYSSDKIHPHMVAAVTTGAKVHITGRIRQDKYITPVGDQITLPYVLVDSLEFIDPKEELNYE